MPLQLPASRTRPIPTSGPHPLNPQSPGTPQRDCPLPASWWGSPSSATRPAFLGGPSQLWSHSSLGTAGDACFWSLPGMACLLPCACGGIYCSQCCLSLTSSRDSTETLRVLPSQWVPRPLAEPLTPTSLQGTVPGPWACSLGRLLLK